MGDVLTARDLRFRYRGGPPVLCGVELAVAPHELVVVIGPNGCGKSTLLRVCSGLEKAESGSVRVEGSDLGALSARQRAMTIGYLPQSDTIDVPFTVFELVLMSRFALQGWWPFEGQADLSAAEAALRRAGVHAFSDRLPQEISGGERQRVQLARTLVNEPKLLLLDEPAASLDPRYQLETYELVRALCTEQPCGAVVVSHDLNLAAMYADRVVVMKDGRVAAVGRPEEVVTPSVLEPVYEATFDEAVGVGGRRLLAPRRSPRAL